MKIRTFRIVTQNIDRLAAAFIFFGATAASEGRQVLVGQRPPDFSTWFDIERYLASAHAFWHGNLSASVHLYPLLYPLLLAAFAWLPTFYMTLFPDVLCYVATLVGFQMVAARLGIGRWGALLLFLPATVAYFTGGMWLWPWNTTLSAALIWLALGFACEIGDWQGGSSPDLRRYAMLGVLLGLIPLCRPADVVVSGMIGVCLLPLLLVRPRRWRELGAIITGALVPMAAYLALYLAIYGPRLNDYISGTTDAGFNFAWLGWKSYLLLIEPRPWYPYGAGLFLVMPWLPVGLAGLLLAFTERETRWLAALLTLPALAYAVVMLSYIDFLPSGLWAMKNAHYFKWLLPLFTLLAWWWLSQVRRRLVAAALALVLALLPTCVRYEPVPAAEEAPARLVVFSRPKDSFGHIYWGSSVVTDRAGPQFNVLDVHLVPDKRGLVLAEALRRPFLGDEQWLWPATDPLHRIGARYAVLHYVPNGSFRRRAIARYRRAFSFGWPCWLPPYACPLTLPPGP